MEHKHVKSLEDLHMRLLNGRLRKRKKIIIGEEDFERFAAAVKAALPPFDFASHGFKEEEKGGD